MPKTTSFKAGELVKLKSGGPTMTVESIKGNIVKCIWYSGHGSFDEVSVVSACLVSAAQ